MNGKKDEGCIVKGALSNGKNNHSEGIRTVSSQKEER